MDNTKRFESGRLTDKDKEMILDGDDRKRRIRLDRGTYAIRSEHRHWVIIKHGGFGASSYFMDGEWLEEEAHQYYTSPTSAIYAYRDWAGAGA